MKEVTIRVPDEMAKLIEEWTKYIPGMEIVCREECVVADLYDNDLRMVQTLRTLKENGAIRYSYDYTWIMVAMGDGVVKGMSGFRSPQSYVDYLRGIGVEQVPCRSTISDYNNKVYGSFPNWSFMDTDDPSEILRRKNVVKQFLSAFNKA